MNKEAIILIPAGRPAPIMTLENHQPKKFKVVIVSDPAHLASHKSWIEEKKFTNVTAVKGKKGLVPQIIYLYQLAHIMGFEWVYRLDDDLRPKCFVEKEGYSTVDDIGIQMLKAARELKVSMVGPESSCNRLWLKEGIRRSVGHVTGGCQLFKSCADPVKQGYISTEITTGAEDVFRTLSHRKECGAVGKLSYVGFDKRKSCGGADSIIKDTQNIEQVKRDAEVILRLFPDLVKCTGEKDTLCGRMMTWKSIGRPTKLTGDE